MLVWPPSSSRWTPWTLAAVVALAPVPLAPAGAAHGADRTASARVCIERTAQIDARLKYAIDGGSVTEEAELRRSLRREEQACCARVSSDFYWCNPANDLPGPANDPARQPWDPLRHYFPGRDPALNAYVTCRPVQYINQPERRDGDRIAVEAASIEVVNCNARQYYIYHYLKRRAFRVVQPPNWGIAIGGRDFAQEREAMLAAASASPGTTPTSPPDQPTQAGLNCRQYCMDHSGYAPSDYMYCTNIPKTVTGNDQQCAAIAVRAKSGPL